MSNTPANWYPDPEQPGRLRYWDGAQWTEHRRPMPGSQESTQQPEPPVEKTPAFEQPGPNGHELRVSPDGRYWWDGAQWRPTGATAGPQRKSSLLRNVLIGGLSLLVLGSCMAALGGGDDSDQSNTSASGFASKESEVGVGDDDEQHGPDLPPEQVAFLAAVAAGQEAAEGANELQVVEARKERADAMCDAVPRRRVENWVGVVEEVSTTLGGDSGVLTLEVAEDVAIGTWNNGVSDIGDGTLVEVDSEVWNAMIDFDEGDEIYFSGTLTKDPKNCVRESSLMDENGMLTPTFIMKFSAVGLVSGGPLHEIAGESEPVDVADEPEPDMTVAQENALRSAEGYLDYSAFSRSGLMKQLKFEGYSAKDAAFAVDAVDVNWRRQAAESAEDYLSYSSFSRSALIEQLMFEGFTRGQAEYGATQAGL